MRIYFDKYIENMGKLQPISANPPLDRLKGNLRGGVHQCNGERPIQNSPTHLLGEAEFCSVIRLPGGSRG
jgi:hypothetical protein